VERRGAACRLSGRDCFDADRRLQGLRLADMSSRIESRHATFILNRPEPLPGGA
jgi:hypothetical protein